MWELDCKVKWAPKNWCFWTVVLKKTLKSPFDCKEIKSVNPKRNESRMFIQDWCWSWNSNALGTWCEELTHWKRPSWCKRLKAGGKGNDRGWDGWMASPTRWTCVLVNPLEKEMATHSSVLVWRIPGMGKPGGLQSMGSLFIFMHWRRKWQPAPVFLSGESQGWGSLVGCCLWGHTESDTTEVT